MSIFNGNGPVLNQRIVDVSQPLAILCHPSRASDAEEFAAQISAQLDRGDKLTVLADNDCPADKVYVVNQDFYNHYGENPWEVLDE